MDKKISVVINTYNAEKHLETVLESVSAFDEVVICDMESTDQTLEIAHRHNCKIVTFPRANHKICEPARDFAIHSASNDWVFVVDADEIVPETLREYLYDIISHEDFTGALAIPRINKFLGIAINDTPDFQLRFFLKNDAKWPPIIHSRPVIDGTVKNLPFRNGYCLIHLDDASISARVNKMNTYTDYEVPKRLNKKYGLAKLLVRPLWFFLKSYLIGGGIKKGKRA